MWSEGSARSAHGKLHRRCQSDDQQKNSQHHHGIHEDLTRVECLAPLAGLFTAPGTGRADSPPG